MKDLFISYSSANIDIVRAFLKDFDSNRITTWIDIENLFKESGKPFGDEIMRNIDNSSAFFLIYTKEAIESEYVKKELEYAISRNKTILCFPYFPGNTDLNYQKHRYFSDHLGQIQWLCNSQQLSRIQGLTEYIQGNERFKDLKALIEDLPDREDDKFAVDVILARIGIQIYLKKPITPFGMFHSLECNSDVYKNDELVLKVLNKSFFVTPDAKQSLRIKSFLDKSEEKWRKQMREINKGYEIENQELYNQMVRFICEQCRTDATEANKIVNEAIELAVCNIEKAMETEKLMFNGPMVGIYNIKIDRTPGDEDSILKIDFYQSDYFTFKFTGELFHLLKKKGVQFDIKLGNITPYAPFLCSLGLGGFIIVRHGEEDYLQWIKRSNIIQAKNMWHFSYDETVHLVKDLRLDKNQQPVRTEDGSLLLDPDVLFHRALKEELRLENKLSPDFKKGIFEIGLIECDRLEIELLSFAFVETSANRSIEEQLRIYTDSAKDKVEREKIDYIGFTEEDINKNLQGKFVTPEAFTLAERLMLFKEEGFFNRIQPEK